MREIYLMQMILLLEDLIKTEAFTHDQMELYRVKIRLFRMELLTLLTSSEASAAAAQNERSKKIEKDRSYS